MTVEDQIEKLESAVYEFAATVSALDDSLILRSVHGWTPRDILVHLIGWNRHIVQGSKQILRGELPFYDVDPGPDYSRVNAALIRVYRETKRDVLLESLAASVGDLTEYLRSLAPEDWDRDFGVRHDDETLTVKSTVADLIADYDHHRAQLEELRAD